MSEKTKSAILMVTSVAVVVLMIWFAGARRNIEEIVIAPPGGSDATSTAVAGNDDALPPDLPPETLGAPESEFTPAPKGDAPAEFPRRLILGAGAKVNGGYTIKYEAGFVQQTAEYLSSDSVVALFNKYKNYFAENSWRVTNEIIKNSGSRGLGAEKEGVGVSVSIVKRPEGSKVSVSYVEVTD